MIMTTTISQQSLRLASITLYAQHAGLCIGSHWFVYICIEIIQVTSRGYPGEIVYIYINFVHNIIENSLAPEYCTVPLLSITKIWTFKVPSITWLQLHACMMSIFTKLWSCYDIYYQTPNIIFFEWSSHKLLLILWAYYAIRLCCILCVVKHALQLLSSHLCTCSEELE